MAKERGQRDEKKKTKADSCRSPWIDIPASQFFVATQKWTFEPYQQELFCVVTKHKLTLPSLRCRALAGGLSSFFSLLTVLPIEYEEETRFGSVCPISWGSIWWMTQKKWFANADHSFVVSVSWYSRWFNRSSGCGLQSSQEVSERRSFQISLLAFWARLASSSSWWQFSKLRSFFVWMIDATHFIKTRENKLDHP